MSLIKLGISACLLGEPVRYDGDHHRDRFITGTLGRFFEFVPVCPETECGLGVPREPMRLVDNTEAPRLLTVRTGLELTDRLQTWTGRKLASLISADLSGFIFKSKSPSCGPARVKVYDEQGKIIARSAGLFARMFMKQFPLLPVTDEANLEDPEFREHFIEKLFFWRRWRELTARAPDFHALLTFHTRHKYQLLAHSTENYRQMGQMVAQGRELTLPQLLADYAALALAAWRLKASPSKHANVLHHLLGYFKKQLSRAEKQEILEAVEFFRGGESPLIVPLTLINHYVRQYQEPYLKEQTYLNPDPLELRLRNHA